MGDTKRRSPEKRWLPLSGCVPPSRPSDQSSHSVQKKHRGRLVLHQVRPRLGSRTSFPRKQISLFRRDTGFLPCPTWIRRPSPWKPSKGRYVFFLYPPSHNPPLPHPPRTAGRRSLWPPWQEPKEPSASKRAAHVELWALLFAPRTAWGAWIVDRLGVFPKKCPYAERTQLRGSPGVLVCGSEIDSEPGKTLQSTHPCFK